MKTLKLLGILAIACVITFGLNSCSDEPSGGKPNVTLIEVGHDNSRHAHPGHDLHIEAEIIAKGIINNVRVEIRQQGGNESIVKEFTSGQYIGVKNTTFHEHIDIPASTPLGKYTLSLSATDKNGDRATAECDITMEEGGAEPD